MKSVWIWDWKTFFSVQKEKTLFFVDNNQGSTFACRVMIKDSISINHAFCVHGSYESMARKHTKTKRIHQRNHFNYSVASCTSHSIDFRLDFVIYTIRMCFQWLWHLLLNLCSSIAAQSMHPIEIESLFFMRHFSREQN